VQKNHKASLRICSQCLNLDLPLRTKTQNRVKIEPQQHAQERQQKIQNKAQLAASPSCLTNGPQRETYSGNTESKSLKNAYSDPKDPTKVPHLPTPSGMDGSEHQRQQYVHKRHCRGTEANDRGPTGNPTSVTMLLDIGLLFAHGILCNWPLPNKQHTHAENKRAKDTAKKNKNKQNLTYHTQDLPHSCNKTFPLIAFYPIHPNMQ